MLNMKIVYSAYFAIHWWGFECLPVSVYTLQETLCMWAWKVHHKAILHPGIIWKATIITYLPIERS